MLFVQEATTVCGVADRVIADILPDVFPYLRVPLAKVGGEHCPMPSSPELEELMMPSVRKIFRAAMELLEEY